MLDSSTFFILVSASFVRTRKAVPPSPWHSWPRTSDQWWEAGGVMSCGEAGNLTLSHTSSLLLLHGSKCRAAFKKTVRSLHGWGKLRTFHRHTFTLNPNHRTRSKPSSEAGKQQQQQQQQRQRRRRLRRRREQDKGPFAALGVHLKVKSRKTNTAGAFYHEKRTGPPSTSRLFSRYRSGLPEQLRSARTALPRR